MRSALRRALTETACTGRRHTHVVLALRKHFIAAVIAEVQNSINRPYMSAPPDPSNTLQTILRSLTDNDTTISTLLLTLLDSTAPMARAAVKDVANTIDVILRSLCQNACTSNATVAAIHRLAGSVYMDELKSLAKKEAGLHFNASRATEADLEGFNLAEIVEKVSQLAPNVCNLVDSLLNADADITRRRKKRRRRRAKRQRRMPTKVAPDAQSDVVHASSDAMQVEAPIDTDDDTELWAALPYLELPAETSLEAVEDDVEMEDADLDETTPPDEDDEYWDGLEPLPEDPDDPESLTDPYKEEARYDAILKMVSAVK